MVSIHIVPIVVYLTIRVLCFIFRFMRETRHLLQSPGKKLADSFGEIYNK